MVNPQKAVLARYQSILTTLSLLQTNHLKVRDLPIPVHQVAPLPRHFRCLLWESLLYPLLMDFHLRWEDPQ